MRIDVEGLVLRYGDTTALDGLTFSLAGEKIYGLLGRSGSGPLFCDGQLFWLRLPAEEIRTTSFTSTA